MIKTNYHTHCHYCDGKGEISEIVQAAVNKGFTALGFSSHAPLPMENEWTMKKESMPDYLKELSTEKNLKKDKIEIYSGLEIDYIPGIQSPEDPYFKSLDLDFAIASVHSTDSLDANPDYACVDGTPEDLMWLLDNLYDGKFENLSQAYYTRIRELCRLDGFQILGHFDLIKKFNSNRDWFNPEARWYQKQVNNTLDVLSGSGKILEVNTGGISRGYYTDEPYPSPWILSEAFKRDIPVTLSADAHSPEALDCYFKESKQLVKDCGYREYFALLQNRWTTVTL